MDDVQRILSSLVTGSAERFDEVGTGALTPSDAAGADRAECERLGAVFAGQDDRYATVAGWNGRALADHLRERMARELPDEEDDAVLIACAFAVFMHKVYDTFREISDSNGLEIEQTLRHDIKSFAMALIGATGND